MTTRIKEWTYCARCGTGINWHIDNIADHKYAGAIDKLLHHQKELQCKREVKLKELLQECIK